MLLGRINRLEQKLTREIERPLKAAGTYVIGSIVRNFNESGRPTKWQGLKASTVSQRRRGSGRGGVKPLVDSGRLRNSMAMSVNSEGVRVGTNVPYAAVQHFGGEKEYTIEAKKKALRFGGPGGFIFRRRVKHPPLPKRPFMMLQVPEDTDAIGYIFKRHLELKA